MTELRIARINFNDEDLVVDFTNKTQLRIRLINFPRLRAATPDERNGWSLIGRGRGVHWEKIDEDLSVENLLAAYSRSKNSDYVSTS